MENNFHVPDFVQTFLYADNGGLKPEIKERK